ncbi:MAG TPA: hypothetical protein VHV29_11020 [Terriglobales bacterium]|jgi:hypothetical protein|nr:hypothetical protein [Terriglobales bacterium]
MNHMNPSRLVSQQTSFTEAILRRAATGLLILALGFAGGCKKKDPPPAQAAGAATSHSRTNDISYLPQDIFGPEAVAGATELKPVDIHSLSDSELKYGIAPKRTGNVEYQPDVIVMEHGDKAIRSLATNGMEWEFDANAEHVSEFQEGKIVFATGGAVGRIVSLKKEGDSVKAILGPIQLTDVIKNGKFKMDSPVSADNMISYVAPDFPQEPDPQSEKRTSSNQEDGRPLIERAVVVSRIQNGVWTPVSVGETYPDGQRATFQRVGSRWVSPGPFSGSLDQSLQLNSFKPFHYTAFQQLPGVPGMQLPEFPSIPFSPQPPAKTAGTVPTVDVGDLRTTAVSNPSYIGVQFYSKKLSGGLFVFAEALMDVNDVHLHFDLDIQGSHINTCGLDLGGALGVTLHMDSYTTKDFQVNLHKKWWVPIDLTIPIGLGAQVGIPFSVTFNMMLNVNSGFSAKQSILTAQGDYTYKGGLWAGYKRNGGWQVNPVSDLQARTDMGRSIQGVSVGINSLVLAASIRAMVGIGKFGFNTGVYIGLRFDGTLLRQADIALPCRQATIDVFMDSGVGYSLPGFVANLINGVLSFFTKYQIDRVGTLLKGPSKDLFHGNTQIPAACATSSDKGS